MCLYIWDAEQSLAGGLETMEKVIFIAGSLEVRWEPRGGLIRVYLSGRLVFSFDTYNERIV